LSSFSSFGPGYFNGRVAVVVLHRGQAGPPSSGYPRSFGLSRQTSNRRLPDDQLGWKKYSPRPTFRILQKAQEG
jgi:hypothetical protein